MKIKMKVLTFVTLSTALLFSTLNAGTLDGVSIIINKEPITLYDVYKYSQRFNITKKEALDILVRQKLEDSEIKSQGINADSFEVDQYIENLAISNGVSQYEFLNMVRSKNIDVAEYKEDLKSKIKRDKLYKKILSNKMQQMNDSELQTYYKQHAGEFSQASSFDVTVYTSLAQENLITIQKNPMSPATNVDLKDATLEAGKIDPNLAMMLNQTANGSFSTIVKSGEAYVMFYVKNKNDVKTVSFEEAKNYIYSRLADTNEKKAIDEYFEKLKASASINVIRAP
ncbi:MAG: peptidylprolyl isomerase [Sulfurospirillaceae bacterium]|nr:peptidylprolyl isomerase [Sulfurospirillaceae bacterium]